MPKHYLLNLGRIFNFQSLCDCNDKAKNQQENNINVNCKTKKSLTEIKSSKDLKC